MGRTLLRVVGWCATGFLIGLGVVLALIVRDPEAFMEEDPFGDGFYGP